MIATDLQKQHAYKMVAEAYRSGRLVLPTVCESCGEEPGPADDGRRQIHGHHWSYAPQHALDLIPLCVTCHRRVHSGHISEPRTGRIYKPDWLPRETFEDRIAVHDVIAFQHGKAGRLPVEVAAALRGAHAQAEGLPFLDYRAALRTAAANARRALGELPAGPVALAPRSALAA